MTRGINRLQNNRNRMQRTESNIPNSMERTDKAKINIISTVLLYVFNFIAAFGM